MTALCARGLEIHALIHSADEALLLDGPDGLTIALISAAPSGRSPLETLFTFLLFKNGVHMAYGPLAVFGGCCELGMNLFPEFRGGEVRRWYGQLMRESHHRLGVVLFLLTRYAIGEDNEKARRRRDPRHRSDRRTLRRLSASEAALDLSAGRRRPIDQFRLSGAATRRLAGGGPGDRAAAEARCARRLGRLLDVDAGARAVRHAAPVLDLIPDLARWSRAERTALARLLDAEDAPSERKASQLSARHPRQIGSLLEIARASARL